MTVSFFHNVWDRPGKTCEVDEILNLIKSGEWAEETQRAREIKKRSADQYKAAKYKLPAVTFCGLFNSDRTKSGLTEASGFLVVDIDDLSDAVALKSEIIKNPYVYACFISLGGAGLKILFRTGLTIKTDADYKTIFAALSEAVENKYCVSVDQSGKDISRLCTVSHDPDLYLNKNAEYFNRQIFPPPVVIKPMQENRDGKENIAAIKYALDLVSAAPDGKRHYSRLKAGRLIGGMVAGGIAGHNRLDELISRARANTENAKNAETDVINGYKYGMREPIWK